MLQTQRLELLPLNAEQLQNWTENLPALEQELFCTYRATPMEGFFGDIVRGQRARVMADPENWLYTKYGIKNKEIERCVLGKNAF